MINTASRRFDAVYTAYRFRIGLFLVWWALSPATLAEIMPHNEHGTFPAELRISGGTGLSSPFRGPAVDRNPRADQSDFTDSHVYQMSGYRKLSAALELRSKICSRPRHDVDPQVHRVSGQAHSYHDGGGFERDLDFRRENGLDSKFSRYWISKSISLYYLALVEYVNLDALYRNSQSRGEPGNIQVNPKHCQRTMRVFKPSENRFRIETVYKKTLVQSSWLDRYADSYPGASHSTYQDFDAIFPALEFIDKSLTAVYRPGGKVLSLRYEDSKGSSIYSQITLFF